MATERNNLGAAWNSLGEYDKAIGYYDQAHQVFRAALGETHPSTNTAAENLSAAKAALTEPHREGG